MTEEQTSPTGSDAGAVLLDADGVVRVNLACRTCGHNVRGQRYDARCPECGDALDFLRPDRLWRSADPQWLERLALGAKCCVVGFLLWCIAMSDAAIFLWWAPALQPAIGLACGLIMLFGCWLVTMPSQQLALDESTARQRRLLRIGAAAAIALSLGAMIVLWPLASFMLHDALSFVAGVAWLIAGAALLGHFRQLLAASGAKVLARRAVWLRRWFIISMIPAWILVSITAFVTRAVVLGSFRTGGLISEERFIVENSPLLANAMSSSSHKWATPELLGILNSVTLPVSLVWYAAIVVMLFFTWRFGREMQTQAELARQAWALAPAIVG